MSALIETVAGQLRRDDFWNSRFHNCDGARSFHLGVFVAPLLNFVLDGRKSVESRFSIHKCAPYHSVTAGDVVLIKESGGPVTAVAEVSNVWSYELDPQEIAAIKKRFGPLLCVDEQFWEEKADCLYATLMRFSSVRKIDPVICEKRDRRGWVVLQRQDRANGSLQENLMF